MFILITGILCSPKEWQDMQHYEGSAPEKKFFCNTGDILLNTPIRYKEKEELLEKLYLFKNQDLIMVVDHGLRKNVIIKGSIPLIKDVLPTLSQSLDKIDLYTIFDNDFVAMAS